MNLRNIAIGTNPVTLAAARLHLKLDTFGVGGTHPDDSLVDTFRSAARGNAERYMRRRVARDTVELRVEAFARKIALPLAPVVSFTSLKYLDADEVEQTLDPSAYTFIDSLSDPHVVLDWNWPVASDRVDAIRLRYTCGYGVNGGDAITYALPDDIMAAMLLMITHMYENRSTVQVGNLVTQVPLSAQYLMDMYQLEQGV